MCKTYVMYNYKCVRIDMWMVLISNEFIGCYIQNIMIADTSEIKIIIQEEHTEYKINLTKK